MLTPEANIAALPIRPPEVRSAEVMGIEPMSLVPESQPEEIIRILSLPPNPKLPAVNGSIVPSENLPHPENEPIIMAINYGDESIGNYGDGVIKAIGRGQQVTLVIEQPPNDKPLPSAEEWRVYIEKIVGKYQPATFIVGNEVNAPAGHPQSLLPAQYVSLYETAHEVIKRISPRTQVFLYGEAHYGKGEYLSVVLWLLKGRNIPFDGIAIHYYGDDELMASRVALYQRVLRLNRFSGKPIMISELGVPENFPFLPDNNAYASEMVKLLARAACLQKEGRIKEADWYTAASFANQKNSLFELVRWGNNQVFVRPTASVEPWMLTTRLLYRVTGIRTDRYGLVTVSGRTASGEKTAVVWATRRTSEYQVPAGVAVYDLAGQKIAQGGEVISVTTEPVFIF